MNVKFLLLESPLTLVHQSQFGPWALEYLANLNPQNRSFKIVWHDDEQPFCCTCLHFSAIKAHGIKLDFDYKSHDPIPLQKFPWQGKHNGLNTIK